MNENLVLTIQFLHILCAIVGFGGVLLNGIYAGKARKVDAREGLAILETNWRASQIAEIAIYLVFVFGLILAIDGELFDQTWLSMSMGLYIIALIISLAVIQPTARKLIDAQRRMAEGDASAREDRDRLGSRIAAASGVDHLIFVVILLLMVFRWGA